MKRVKKISVVVVSDNHYLPMLAALIKSIEANISKESLLNLWIISDCISAKNKEKLAIAITPEITQIHWVNAKEIIPPHSSLPLDNSTFPLNIYLWYFIPYFIPADIERVIYIDVDMLNCRDLTELWETDLQNKIIGAVPDPRIRIFECEWGGILNYKQLGFNGSKPYFNSGILLIDLPKWRQNNITEKALHFVEDNINYAVYPEQYGINIALVDQWHELNPLWNFFATIYNKATPYNIHFVDRKPIYSSYKSNPAFRQQFNLYLKQTPWDEFQPIGEPARYLKKIKNVVVKVKKRIINKFVFKQKKQSL